MKRLSITIAALAPLACLPAPKDAGQAESVGLDTDADLTTGDFTATGATTIEDATADGATETGQAPADADVEWSLELDPTASIHRMIRSPDGVVAVLQANDPLAPSAELLEVTADMDVPWSKPLPDSWVADLDPVGGGGYLLAGQKTMAGMPVATAWRMSCCDDFQITSSPLQNDVPAAFVVAELLDDGILMAIDDGSATTSFIRIPFDLSIDTALGSLDFRVLDGARTPAGDLVLRATEGGDAHLLYEMAGDGTGSGYGPGQLTMLVGEGDGLALMTFGNEQLGIQPYDGGAVVQVPVPGLSLERIAMDRRDRFALAFRKDEPEGGSTVHVSEFDETGAVLRELVLPRLHHDQAVPTAVAVGEDDAIYVAVGEGGLGGASATILHRIAPL